MGAQIFADFRRARFRGAEKAVSDADLEAAEKRHQSIDFG
jgi:hypothetical protein